MIKLGSAFPILLAAACAVAQSVTLTGTVLNMTGAPIAGATVKFKALANTATTNAEGKYNFANAPLAIKRVDGYRLVLSSEGRILDLSLDRSEYVTVEAHAPSGRMVLKVADRVLQAGRHGFDLAALGRAHQLYLVKVRLGAETGWHKMTLQGGLSHVTAAGELSLSPRLAKSAAAESVYVTHANFHGGLARINGRTIASTAGTQNFRMFSKDTGWNVCAPPFTFNFDGSAGSLYYQKIIAGPETTNQEVLREVCQSIWAIPADVPTAKRFKSYIADINATVTTGVAATGGNKLFFNVGYINNQKGSGDANAWYEIVGVLVHEAVHSYQPYYSTQGADGFGEAVPDAIRALTGFFRWPTGSKCSGSYTENYQTGGKYWYYIEQKHPGFINKIYKLTSGDISTRVQQVTGASLSSLVSECQTKGMP